MSQRRSSSSLILCLVFAGCTRGTSDASRSSPTATEPGTPATAEAASASSSSWVEVEARALREEAPAVGSFHARQTTRVGAEVSGEVLAVLVDVGAAVTRDQPLVRLDPTFFEIEVAQRRAEVESAKARKVSAEQGVLTAQAEVEHARAAVGDAELRFERMRALWEKPDGQAPSIPKSRFDEADFALREARARLLSAESRVGEAQAGLAEANVGVSLATQTLRYAEERLKRTEITAPFDGVVTARLVDVGEPVTATPVTHLVEVQETAVLYLEFSLPQELLAVVRKGTPVRFEAEGVDDSAAAGTIEVVFPTIDEATRSFRCRVIVDNHEGRFPPGVLARVHVTTRAVEDALVVPRTALAAGEGGWAVRVDAGGGRVAPRRVELGLTTEREVQVLSGLSRGERVLVP